jgi:hypothetical protein
MYYLRTIIVAAVMVFYRIGHFVFKQSLNLFDFLVLAYVIYDLKLTITDWKFWIILIIAGVVSKIGSEFFDQE